MTQIKKIIIGIEKSGIGASDRSRVSYLSQELFDSNKVVLKYVDEDEYVDIRLLQKRDYNRKKNEKILIFDCSDNILVPWKSTIFLKKIYFYLRVRRNIEKFLRKPDALVVASQLQRESAQMYNDNIYIIPELSFYHERFDIHKKLDTRTLKFVWDSKGHYFDFIYNLLKDNLSFFRRKDVQITILTDKKNEITGFDNEKALQSLNVNSIFKEWKEMSFIENVADCHIGLAPRDLDCGHSNAAPANKLVNYQGLGLACIASKIKSFEDFKKNTHGLIYLCESREDWSNALSKIINQKDEIIDQREKAHKFTKKNFGKKNLSSLWLDILNPFIEKLTSDTK